MYLSSTPLLFVELLLEHFQSKCPDVLFLDEIKNARNGVIEMMNVTSLRCTDWCVSDLGILPHSIFCDQKKPWFTPYPII